MQLQGGLLSSMLGQIFGCQYVFLWLRTVSIMSNSHAGGFRCRESEAVLLQVHGGRQLQLKTRREAH
eukprot:g25099.t1